MAWIELHDQLPQHKKIVRLKRILKIRTAQALGHVCMLWLWAVNNAENGSLMDLDVEDIAEIADWQKDAAAFVNALVDVGFVDRSDSGELALHDWSDYAGRLMEQRAVTREQQKKRQQKRREKLRDGHAAVTRDSRVTGTENESDGHAVVTRDSRVNHAHTVPNHNNTVPKRTSSLSDEREEARESLPVPVPVPVLSDAKKSHLPVKPDIATSDYEAHLVNDLGWTMLQVQLERINRGVEHLSPDVLSEKGAMVHEL